MSNKINNKQGESREILNDFQKQLKTIEGQALKKVIEIIKKSDAQKVAQIINSIKK